MYVIDNLIFDARVTFFVEFMVCLMVARYSALSPRVTAV